MAPSSARILTRECSRDQSDPDLIGRTDEQPASVAREEDIRWKRLGGAVEAPDRPAGFHVEQLKRTAAMEQQDSTEADFKHTGRMPREGLFGLAGFKIREQDDPALSC